MRHIVLAAVTHLALTLYAAPSFASAPGDSSPSVSATAGAGKAVAKSSQNKKKSGGQPQSSQRSSSQPSSQRTSAPRTETHAAPPPNAQAGQGQTRSEVPSRSETRQAPASDRQGPQAGETRPMGQTGREAQANPVPVMRNPQQASLGRVPSRTPAGNFEGSQDRRRSDGSVSGANARAAEHHREYVQHRAAADHARQAVTHRRAVAAHHAAAAAHHASHRAWVARHDARWHHYRWNHNAWWRPHPGYHWYRPYWSYGVFVYGPPPGPRTVIVNGSEPAPVEPKRSIDRTHSFSLGVRGGSYMSNYDGGMGYGDFGLGLAGRYRAAEALGFEAAWVYHDQSWTDETARINAPLSLSAELFAFPWSKVNPYVLAGVTMTSRNYNDSYDNGFQTVTVERDDTLWGPHGGLGLELAVGKQASVNFEWRAMGYLNKEETDCSKPGAMEATMGANFYF